MACRRHFEVNSAEMGVARGHIEPESGGGICPKEQLAGRKSNRPIVSLPVPGESVGTEFTSAEIFESAILKSLPRHERRQWYLE